MASQPNPQDYLPLHPLEFRILLVLTDGPVHGYEIVRLIEAAEQFGAIYPANLYRRIRDLEANQLVREVKSPAESGDDSRRRYLGLTPLGRKVAYAEALRLKQLLADPRAARLLATVQAGG